MKPWLQHSQNVSLSKKEELFDCDNDCVTQEQPVLCLTITRLASWVTPFTGVLFVVCKIIFRAGAVTFIVRVQQEEIFIARHTVCGLQTPALFTAFVASLTRSGGSVGIVAETDKKSKSLEHTCTAQTSLHSVHFTPCKVEDVKK